MATDGARLRKRSNRSRQDSAIPPSPSRMEVVAWALGAMLLTLLAPVYFEGFAALMVGVSIVFVTWRIGNPIHKGLIIAFLSVLVAAIVPFDHIFYLDPRWGYPATAPIWPANPACTATHGGGIVHLGRCMNVVVANAVWAFTVGLAVRWLLSGLTARSLGMALAAAVSFSAALALHFSLSPYSAILLTDPNWETWRYVTVFYTAFLPYPFFFLVIFWDLLPRKAPSISRRPVDSARSA